MFSAKLQDRGDTCERKPQATPPGPGPLPRLRGLYSPDLFHVWASIQGLAQAQCSLWAKMAGCQAEEREGVRGAWGTRYGNWGALDPPTLSLVSGCTARP